MKEVPVGNDKVLLIKDKNNTFYAVGNKCSHYGAPLVKGVRSALFEELIPLGLFKR